MESHDTQPWHKDLRFVIPTIISLLALAIPIVREDIINRPTSGEAQLLVSPAAISLAEKGFELTIEGRGFHGDIDKRVKLEYRAVHLSERPTGAPIWVISRDVLVDEDGAFTDKVKVGEIYTLPGVYEVSAWSILKSGYKKRAAYQYSIL